MRLLSLVATVLATVFASHSFAQVVGPSINMVTGTEWPTGDPFLQRQNEPSMAVSSRNPLHLVAGNNDYRTVDLPGVSSNEPTGDAWLGFFTSMDGGNSWQSTLVPGYPQDKSQVGNSSPSPLYIGGYNAAADPTVRAGTNGLFYYSGLAFTREDSTISGGSAVFLARYVDDNNVQGSNSVRYIDTKIVASYNNSADPKYFADKPVMAVDMPRDPNSTCGRVYIAYTRFSGGEGSNQSSIMLTWSSDCGVTWRDPQQVSGNSQTNQGASLAIDPKNGNVYIVWRIFKDNTYPDSIAGTAFQYGTSTLTQILQAPISPFDQGTSDVTFRTNAYPSIAVDNAQRIYVAWSQRGATNDRTTAGDARIQVIAGTPTFSGGSSTITGARFSGLLTVDPYKGRGHQIMPAMAFSSGKLTLAWYDFRDDDQVDVFTASRNGSYSLQQELPIGVTPSFTLYAVDPSPPYAAGKWRQTVDIRAAQALPSSSVSFNASVLVSQYAFGTPAPSPDSSTVINLPKNPDDIQQLEFDAPNLPLFKGGTVAFVGDYIDVAGPTFIIDPVSKQWRFNNMPSDPDHTHVVWTDNRNVVQPSDGNWTNYTPVDSAAKFQDPNDRSIFDQNQSPIACSPGQTGMRNQDIYTATLSPGVIMSSRGNFKALAPPSSSTPQTTSAREFPVTVENPTNQTLYFRLAIQSQPTGGSASFLQYPANGFSNPLTQLTVGIPPFSTASRSVFITSSDLTATVAVNAVQTTANNNVISNGLTSSVTLNSDPSNPNISNPNISNVEIYTPNISNPNISNPNISNPNISNPNISNPNISNPNISNVSYTNPNISNPNISNPNISNPNISNPNISNPNISNTALSGEITDASYTVTNSGNTSASYSVNLVQYQPAPSGVTVQLIISGVYLTPVANGCTLVEQPNYTPIANITNPASFFVSPGSVLPSGPPAASAPSFSLEPGQQALITVRVYDSTATTPEQALAHYNPVASLSPAISTALNTGVTPPTGTVTRLAISTSSSLTAGIYSSYSATFQATGGVGPYTWNWAISPTVEFSGSQPEQGFSGPSLTLANPVFGYAGPYTVQLQVTDASGQSVQRSFIITVIQPG